MALPVYSVNDLQEAQQLFTLVGKLDYDGFDLQHYRLTDFSGNFEDLDKATEKLENGYNLIKSHKAMNALGKPIKED